MNRMKSLGVVFVVLAALTIAPLPTSAETMADLYLGVASTSDGDFNTTVDGLVTVDHSPTLINLLHP